jgi:glutathione S-transferase
VTGIDLAKQPNDALTDQFLVHTYFSNAQSQWAKFSWLKVTRKEKRAAKAYGDAVIKEVEPLLYDANPFFGGSSVLTLAEVTSSCL